MGGIFIIWVALGISHIPIYLVLFFLITTLQNVILFSSCYLCLPNKDVYYTIPSAAFSILYWLQPHLEVYRLLYINCH